MGNQNPKGSSQPQQVKKTAPPPQPSESDKQIKMEKTMLLLDRQIQAFEDKQKKYTVATDQLKAKARESVQLGKKPEAKKFLQQAAKLMKHTEVMLCYKKKNFAIRRKVLENKKFQLQTAIMDKSTVSSLQSAQQHLKDQQKVNDKLEEIILQTQQQKMVSQQLTDKMKDMADDDELLQDVDNMLAELERDVKKETAQKIPQKTVQVATQKQKQKQEEEDQISKMMAEL